jgi:hypothetical protein
MPELNAVLVESRRQTAEDRKFFAALKGIDLDAAQTGDAFTRVQERAKKRVEEKMGTAVADPDIQDFIASGIAYEVMDSG